ncbi:hypothetical protein BDZ89DRAFT_1154683 [Hymenopellis radicata]|nr:hypothetical protein BDZ89DRAFT_1154683 [Hymenopellis radicata]
MDYHDDDEVVPTSDTEEQNEIDMRLTLPPTVTYNHALGEHVPAKKRARTPAATLGHFSPASLLKPVWSRVKTPAYCSPPPPSVISPPQLVHNSFPSASHVPVVKSEEDSDDSLDMIFGYHAAETSSQPASGTSSSPRLHSIPPPSMTPVSDRGNYQHEHLSSQDIPMDMDDGWERHQSPLPALTPDADDLMDFGDSERPTTPPLPERTFPIRQDSPLSSPPPSPHAPANNVDPVAPFLDIPPESRYSLRTRKPQQKNPYLYDQVHYKLLMKNNPDAIVKTREVERERGRRNDDQYEQGTQDPEPDEYEHRHRTSHSRSTGHHQSEDLPAGLEALPDFDAEDRVINKDMRDANKELAMIKRRREQEKEEEEKRRRKEQEEEEIREESLRRAATPPSVNDSFRQLSISPQKGTPRLPRSGSRMVISPTPSPVRHSRSLSRIPSPEQPMDIDEFNLDSPLGSRASSPIIVEEGNGSSVHSDSPQSQSESEEEGFENDAGVKVLSRMYPAFMLKGILNGGSKKKQSAPTRPSQKRTKSGRSRSVTKIVGDPESSDEDRRPEQQVDPDDDLVAFGKPGPGPSTLSNSSRVKSERDVIDISTDEEEDYPRHTHYISDDESPEPEDARKWTLFGKEPDMIDYMLLRPVRSEAKRKPRSHHSSKATGKSRRPPGKGKGREIQTKLTDWGGHGRSIRSDGKKIKKGNMPSGDEDEDEPADRTAYSKLTDKERARRELKRRRKEQKSKNGVYMITAPKGARIATGQRRNPHSADLEVEDAVTAPTAKEPMVFQYAPRPAPPKRTAKDPRRGEPLQPEQNNERELSPVELKPPEVDAKKFTFGSNTFIGKGWLFELMEHSAAEPVIISVSGISFSGDMTSQEFLDSLAALWRILFEAIAGLPDSDNDVVSQSCTRLCRAASLVLSYLLRTQPLEEADALRAGVECQIRQLLQKVQSPEFEQETGDHTMWTLLWSAVELGIRIGLTVSAKPEEAKLLVSFADILIARLVRHGLAEAVRSVQSDVVETPLHPVELWVCLFHVLRPASKDDGHIVWSCVENAIKAQGPSDLAPAQMSERLWFIIQALADLSQFSVHGRYSPEGVPYQGWNVVLLALHATSLLPAETRGKRARDKYAASVVQSCARMCNESKWPMKAAFPVLMRLTSIFVSRGFVSLAHEGRDYPKFALDNEWDKFEEPGPKDSAYVTFLKLLLRALPSLKTVEQKKLLTQSISRSKFAFSKSEPPSVKDLSGLTNRFVGIFAAIYAAPDSDHVRIEQANQYVDFESSDDNTRWIAIQGFQLLCRVLVFRRLSLEGVVKWLETIVDALLEDCVTRTKEGPHNVRLLIRSIGYVYSTIADVNNQGIFAYQRPCYPNPTILSKIQRIARNSSLTKEGIPLEVQVAIQEEVLRTYHAFFRARATAVPSPNKPVVNLTNEESQDSAFDGLDDDIDDSVLRVAVDYEEQDKAASKMLQADSWYILRFCTSCNSNRKLAEEENLWMETWCSSNAKGDSWATYWKSYVDKLNDRSETAQKMAQTRLLRHILKADPDVYTTPGFMNTVREVVFESLAAKEITTDHTGLVAEVLDVDQAQAQQLFPVVPFPKKDGAYEVIISDFEERCSDLIDGVFSFVDEQLTLRNMRG